MLDFWSFAVLLAMFTSTQAVNLGEHCQDSFYCSYIVNAECRDATCQCLASRTTYQGGCVQGFTPTKTCLQTLDCMTHDPLSICVDGACHCLYGYHLKDGKCFRNRGLYEYCSNDDDCYNGEDQVGLMTCSSMKCSCKSGYEAYRGRRCSGSSRILPATMMAIFTTFGYLFKYL